MSSAPKFGTFAAPGAAFVPILLEAFVCEL